MTRTWTLAYTAVSLSAPASAGFHFIQAVRSLLELSTYSANGKAALQVSAVALTRLRTGTKKTQREKQRISRFHLFKNLTKKEKRKKNKNKNTTTKYRIC